MQRFASILQRTQRVDCQRATTATRLQTKLHCRRTLQEADLCGQCSALLKELFATCASTPKKGRERDDWEPSKRENQRPESSTSGPEHCSYDESILHCVPPMPTSSECWDMFDPAMYAFTNVPISAQAVPYFSPPRQPWPRAATCTAPRALGMTLSGATYCHPAVACTREKISTS